MDCCLIAATVALLGGRLSLLCPYMGCWLGSSWRCFVRTHPGHREHGEVTRSSTGSEQKQLHQRVVSAVEESVETPAGRVLRPYMAAHDVCFAPSGLLLGGAAVA
eukprot:49194-Eustigmatos_ZCMA.PRE.1